MSIDEKYFYQGTEGFLGDPEDCKILFLMREPNSEGKKADNQFWFKRVVDGEKLPRSGCYLSKLGQIASLLLKIPACNNEQRIPALRQAAYININPVCGQGTASNEYGDAIKWFKEEKEKCEILGKEYDSRWKIIFGMPNQGWIVTVGDIYDAMYKVLDKKKAVVKKEKQDDGTKKKQYDGTDWIAPRLAFRDKQPMRSFVFTHDGKRINVLNCIHPAAFRKHYYRAEDIQLLENNKRCTSNLEPEA